MIKKKGAQPKKFSDQGEINPQEIMRCGYCGFVIEFDKHKKYITKAFLFEMSKVLCLGCICPVCKTSTDISYGFDADDNDKTAGNYIKSLEIYKEKFETI